MLDFGSLLVLVQDATTKRLTPELIRVAGGANQPKVFARRGATTPSAWLYALQAAKVSITVYGVWLGHVYQWHIVTAAHNAPAASQDAPGASKVNER